MDKITQVYFPDIGKVTTQYVEVPHQELKPHEVQIALCSMGYAVRICMF